MTEDKETSEETTKTVAKIVSKNKDKFTDSGVKTFLDWITNHKIYTVVLLILITFGFGKVANHFKDYRN